MHKTTSCSKLFSCVSVFWLLTYKLFRYRGSPVTAVNLFNANLSLEKRQYVTHHYTGRIRFKAYTAPVRGTYQYLGNATRQGVL